jgi:hypothetical protein
LVGSAAGGLGAGSGSGSGDATGSLAGGGAAGSLAAGSAGSLGAGVSTGAAACGAIVGGADAVSRWWHASARTADAAENRSNLVMRRKSRGADSRMLGETAAVTADTDARGAVQPHRAATVVAAARRRRYPAATWRTTRSRGRSR